MRFFSVRYEYKNLLNIQLVSKPTHKKEKSRYYLIYVIKTLRPHFLLNKVTATTIIILNCSEIVKAESNIFIYPKLSPYFDKLPTELMFYNFKPTR